MPSTSSLPSENNTDAPSRDNGVAVLRRVLSREFAVSDERSVGGSTTSSGTPNTATQSLQNMIRTALTGGGAGAGGSRGEEMIALSNGGGGGGGAGGSVRRNQLFGRCLSDITIDTEAGPDPRPNLSNYRPRSLPGVTVQASSQNPNNNNNSPFLQRSELDEEYIRLKIQLAEARERTDFQKLQVRQLMKERDDLKNDLEATRDRTRDQKELAKETMNVTDQLRQYAEEASEERDRLRETAEQIEHERDELRRKLAALEQELGVVEETMAEEGEDDQEEKSPYRGDGPPSDYEENGDVNGYIGDNAQCVEEKT